MYPATFAESAPDRPAVIMGNTGEVVTYRELDERSNQIAHLLRSRGLGPASILAVCMENNSSYHILQWAARRSGLYFVPINYHLTADEVAYIVNDSGADALVTSAATAELAAQLTTELIPSVKTRLILGAEVSTWENLADAVADQPVTKIDDELEGDILQYSSGTTGRPKGIKRPFTVRPISLAADMTVAFLQAIGFSEGGIFLSPAPLYHTAPIVWSSGVHRMGGTAVVMERFDPVKALELIQQYKVTHSLLVPTMFVRMLKLPTEQRLSFDVSSLQTVIHAAAPCPVEIKRQMIEWWGPKISEFYSSSEVAGATFITAPDWLEHPGSVGKPMLGTPHVLDDEGNELGSGEIGQIWFDGGVPFEYHNDPEKTKNAWDTHGYSTVGDIGYVDAEGYLYLTDRKSFMIISGGVNIYPQEAENVLIEHPKVYDAAVFGVPNPEMGEEVKAVVQPKNAADAGPELEAELIAYCKSKLAGYKCPKSIDFRDTLPRSDTGKLFKRELQQEYKEKAAL
ncbi:MAG: Long-chain-fatty-acid--CoA ligase [Pseudonocardiales bacterium]|nr:Long-chain-fatty-acid--CoA ligase [Pseudonocardiales bacterium]